MATAIPSSMTFEMLSRLPPNSFVQVWKEIRPSVAPQNNRYTIQANGTQRVNFVIRGAPNEFLLNTDCYLSGSSYTKAVVAGPTGGVLNATDLAILRTKPPVQLNKPIHFFQSSRESFNSGSLPFLDNQDPVASHEINELRAAFTQRNHPMGVGEQQLEDCDSWLGSVASRYETRSVAGLMEQNAVMGAPFRGVYKSAAGPPDTYSVVTCGKNRDFRIPLGVFSNLVNSHSVIPIGLMSSYSVNGWQLDLDISNQSGTSGSVYDAQLTVLNTVGETPTALTVSAPTAVIADLRIYACVIRVLDPSVMEAVLSLYEKREMVNVGGVQFPLSLRLNSLGYRFSRFPLTQPQTDYYFRITGTDRSVRAIAWRVFAQTSNSVGEWILPTGLCLTRLETTIGSELPHPVIEDQTPQTTNVSNFLALNAKRSGSLFSSLPYYQEGVKHDGDASDVWSRYNNALTTFTGAVDVPLGSGATNFVKTYVERTALCQGIISFENLDRREGDFSGSFQASGKDLTNVGAIELRMRFQKVVSPTLSSAAAPGAPDLADNLTFGPLDNSEASYQIVFAYVYDSVMEVSPQGVMDITNATL